MHGQLEFNSAIDSSLNIQAFSSMLDHITFSYKFYWLEGIIRLCINHVDRNAFFFEEIIDEMIVSAFSSVAEYRLHLAIIDENGESIDAIERAVNLLLQEDYLFDLERKSSAEDVRSALKCLKEYDGDLANTLLLKTAIEDCKKQSVVYVPFRLLSSFKKLDQMNLKDPKDALSKNIQYFNELNKQVRLPYLVEKGTNALDRKVIVDDLWKDLFLKQNTVLFDWIDFQKAMYLQKLNPGVPGIIYKLGNYVGSRKLSHAKKLWDGAMEVHEFKDIYTNEVMDRDDQSLDHFIPWSYIANDELWNLIPTTKSMNSSKSDHLPEWNIYFELYAHEQYELYELIHNYDELYNRFTKCRNDNLHAIWAITDLYRNGNDEVEFTNILEKNMKPIFDAAKIQGYAEDIFTNLL